MSVSSAPRCLLFDLDGTLVDSVPDLASALNFMLAARGLTPFAEAAVAAMVGDGVGVLIARAFAARGAVPDAAAVADYTARYGAHVADATRPYPGAHAALARLAGEGWTLAVATNKPERLAHAVLEATGLDDFFASVGGGDSFPVRKPDPGHLLATLAAAGAAPARALMVGDHRNDIAAAHGAGMGCIFAGWGYGEPGMEEGAAAIAPDFAAIPALAARLLPA
jgi:phosphoglycolate phosphatase